MTIYGKITKRDNRGTFQLNLNMFFVYNGILTIFGISVVLDPPSNVSSPITQGYYSKGDNKPQSVHIPQNTV